MPVTDERTVESRAVFCLSRIRNNDKGNVKDNDNGKYNDNDNDKDKDNNNGKDKDNAAKGPSGSWQH